MNNAHTTTKPAGPTTWDNPKARQQMIARAAAISAHLCRIAEATLARIATLDDETLQGAD